MSESKSNNLYQSILYTISTIPEEHLAQVDHYLKDLANKLQNDKNENRQKIMSLAGTWSANKD